MSQDIWPDGVLGIGRLRDNPEALAGVMDNGNYFVSDRCHGPVLAQEVQSVIGVESALEIESQVQIQQGC